MVINTIVVGKVEDTKLSMKKVLNNKFFLMPEEISQVLFVVDGRFTYKEIATFNSLKVP